MLPRRIPKREKRASRWKSQKHRDFVRGHACSFCGSMTAVEFAHIREGSGAGMGQKPDDWFGVSLCAECHRTGPRAQHIIGEDTFWAEYRKQHGQTRDQLIAEFVRASPCRADIERVQRERANG